MTSLEKLKRLTDALTITPPRQQGSQAIIETIIGEDATMDALKHNPSVAVADIHLAKGSQFPTHAHYEFEVAVIYRGTLSIRIGEEIAASNYSAPDVVKFDREIEHTVTALTDTDLIAVSIPAIKTWPKYGS